MFGDLGYGQGSGRRKGDQLRTMWVANQEGLAVPYMEQELQCVLGFRLEGLPLNRERVSGRRAPLFGKEVTTLHSQGDTQKADGCFSLELQQDVWVRQNWESQEWR